MTNSELIIRILCDTKPAEQLDGVYLFCQTQDNQPSVIHTAAELIKTQQTNRILISNSHAQSGYPGHASVHAALTEAGIASGDIIGVPFEADPLLNTLTESRALVRFAAGNDIGSLLITSAPFHQVRAFMTAVTAVRKIYPKLALYSRPGIPQPWLEEVAHSQGTTKGTRRKLIAAEMARIDKYQKKGDLADTAEVLAYLDQRDG